MSNDVDIRNLTRAVYELARTVQKLGEIINKFNKNMPENMKNNSSERV